MYPLKPWKEKNNIPLIMSMQQIELLDGKQQ